MLDFDKVRELLLEHIKNEFNSVVVAFARENNLTRYSVDHIIHKHDCVHTMRLNTLLGILKAANINLQVVKGK